MGDLAVFEASKHLLSNGFGTKSVCEALRIVGEGLGVDRVYIFEDSIHEGKRVASQRFEWSKSDIEPQIDNPELQNVPYSEVIPHWGIAFDRGDVVSGLVRTFPSPTKEVLEAQSIISLLVCPIYINKACWGFVGFDDCSTERIWPQELVAALQMLANSLAASLRHNKTKETLEKSRLLLRGLSE